MSWFALHPLDIVRITEAGNKKHYVVVNKVDNIATVRPLRGKGQLSLSVLQFTKTHKEYRLRKGDKVVIRRADYNFELADVTEDFKGAVLTVEDTYGYSDMYNVTFKGYNQRRMSDTLVSTELRLATEEEIEAGQAIYL